MIEEEDWWTDIDVENFYLYARNSHVLEARTTYRHAFVTLSYRGWPEWANRYAVKCPSCEATKWVGVDFVSKEEEQRLEHESHPDAAAAEEIMH